MPRIRCVMCTWGLLCGLVAALGCRAAVTASTDGADEGRLKIVCTTALVRDLVSEIAGDLATVSSLIGSGVDPHLYSARRSDLLKLIDADIVCVNGLHLEGRMSESLRDLSQSGKIVWTLSDAIPISELRSFGPHFHDPHIWMDAHLWRLCAEEIGRKLCDRLPASRDQIERRTQAYATKLEGLDQYLLSTMASIAAERRILITAHDAFGYFGRRYGVEVRGIQGASTEAEASVKSVEDVVDLMVTRRIPALFVETSVNSKTVRAVLEGAAARNWNVTIGEPLYSDAMGEAGTYEGTVIGMLDANADIIARGLRGNSPPGGWQGLLTTGPSATNETAPSQ